jgi:hypothetical protein
MLVAPPEGDWTNLPVVMGIEAENPPRPAPPAVIKDASHLKQGIVTAQLPADEPSVLDTQMNGFDNMADLDIDYDNGYSQEELPDLTPNEIEAWLEQVLTQQTPTADVG